MIKDIKLVKYAPASFYNALGCSPDGYLVLSVRKSQPHGRVVMFGIQVLDIKMGEIWVDLDQDGNSNTNSNSRVKYEVRNSWLEGVRRERWRNCTMKDDMISTQCLGFEATQFSISDLTFSPFQSTDSNRSYIGVLVSTLDVVVFVPRSRSKVEYTNTWSLAEKLAEIAGLHIDSSTEDPIDVHDENIILRLRLHCCDWSKQIGKLDSHNNRAFSILVTGNEAGQILFWNISNIGPHLITELGLSKHWILAVKLSSPIEIDLEFAVDIVASSTAGELYTVRVFISEDHQIRFERATLLVTASTVWTRSVWTTILDFRINVAVRPRGGCISVFDRAGLVNCLQFKTRLYTPVVSVLTEIAASDQIRITIVSILGETESFIYHLNSFQTFACAESVYSINAHIASRENAFLQTSDESVTSVITNVYGLSQDSYSNAIILYTNLAGDRPRYPTISTQWGRIAVIGNCQFEDFWQHHEEDYSKGIVVSTRVFLWRAKLSALLKAQNGERDEIEWIEKSIELVRTKIDSLGDSEDLQVNMTTFTSSTGIYYWRRILASLYNWLLTAGSKLQNQQELIQLKAENYRMICLGRSISILNQALNWSGALDEKSVQMVYQHACFLGTATLAESSFASNLAIEVLDKLSRYGIYVADKISQINRTDEGLFVSKDFNQPDKPFSYTRETQCIACNNFVQVDHASPLGGNMTAKCRQIGHTWVVCSITLMPLMEMHQRHCRSCDQVIAQVDHLNKLNQVGRKESQNGDINEKSLYQQVLSYCDSCIICGDLLYTM
ncbi:uncharacterized protein V1516DRAFT_667321 [Lipomyces oligophaga]|uniref:uncharacterized protein n=1 Tax=Lipomyces oligophaga TaxID=45792 RepID=UPI0034CF6C27